MATLSLQKILKQLLRSHSLPSSTISTSFRYNGESIWSTSVGFSNRYRRTRLSSLELVLLSNGQLPRFISNLSNAHTPIKPICKTYSTPYHVSKGRLSPTPSSPTSLELSVLLTQKNSPNNGRCPSAKNSSLQHKRTLPMVHSTTPACSNSVERIYTLSVVFTYHHVSGTYTRLVLLISGHGSQGTLVLYSYLASTQGRTFRIVLVWTT
jgi:hypothetical protein